LNDKIEIEAERGGIETTEGVKKTPEKTGTRSEVEGIKTDIGLAQDQSQVTGEDQNNITEAKGKTEDEFKAKLKYWAVF
jgi:hypothetical protein